MSDCFKFLDCDQENASVPKDAQGPCIIKAGALLTEMELHSNNLTPAASWHL